MFNNKFRRGDQNEVNLVAYRDLLTNIFGTLLLILGVVMFLIHPVNKKESENDKTLGSLRIELYWPNDLDVDIDLWCKSPDEKPIGYSNSGGIVLNLVRDDLGLRNDISNTNYELIYGRGLPKGEYVCNVHWYSNSANAKTVPVKLIVTINSDENSKSLSQPIVTEAVLRKQGEELTLLRWSIDNDRKLIPGSLNSAFKELRKAN